MAAALPKIWVSKLKRGRLRKQRNAYTGQEDDRQKAWQVTFTYDKFPDRSFDLWFQDDAEASRFALQGLRDLGEVLAAVAPYNSAFTAQPPLEEPRFGKANPYTDQPVQQPSWHSLLWNEQYNRWADLWYGPDLSGQSQASMWAPGQQYGVFDLFRVFNIFVLWYPDAQYVKERSLAGFFDRNGFHKPGIYPAGEYPAGFSFGGFIELDQPTQILGRWIPFSQLSPALKREFLVVIAHAGIGVSYL